MGKLRMFLAILIMALGFIDMALFVGIGIRIEACRMIQMPLMVRQKMPLSPYLEYEDEDNIFIPDWNLAPDNKGEIMGRWI